MNPQPKREEQPVTMGQQRKWLELVKQVWGDEKFKQRFLNNPALVLRESGIEIPAGVEVRVVENTETVSYLVLPSKPAGGVTELTDDQLSSMIGGISEIQISKTVDKSSAALF